MRYPSKHFSAAYRIRLGRALQEARKRAGLSRAKLAKKTGIPMKTIEKYEYGKSEPTVSRFCILRSAIHPHAGDIMFSVLLDVEDALEKQERGE